MNVYTIKVPYIGDNHSSPQDELQNELEASTFCPIPDDLLAVTSRSPAVLRKAVWTFATFFRREFAYDFVQYGDLGNETDAAARAYLWTGADINARNMFPVIGACCFRWRKYKNESLWALQWIWFHPYARQRGHLKAAWPYFRCRFQAFDVELPWSSGMKEFLQVVGYTRPPIPQS